MKTNFFSWLSSFYHFIKRKAVDRLCGFSGKSIIVKKLPVRLHEGNVWFDLEFKIPAHLSGEVRYLYIYVPVFKSSDNKRYALPPLVLRKPAENDEKEGIYMQFENNRNICIVRQQEESMSSYSYRLSVPYEHIEEFDESLPGNLSDTKEQIFLPLGKIDKIKKYTLYNPSFVTKIYPPDKEEVKVRILKSNLKLVFPENHSFIYPGMFGNSFVLNELVKQIKELKEEEWIEIRKITIHAFLQPEGDYEVGKVLAYEQCESLCLYLAEKTGINIGRVEVGTIRENWEMLGRLVRTDKILTDREKHDLSSILRSSMDNLERKKRLMLYNSNSYRYILHNIFPEIHYMECQVEYVIAPLTVEQTKNLLETAPWKLSHYELYQLATSYQEKSPEFKAVIQVAYSQYPEDLLANLNKSTLELWENNISLAGKYLLPFKEDERTTNNLGIYYALNSDYRKAESCFRTSVGWGDNHASANLEELKRLEESSAKYKEEIAHYNYYLGGNISLEQCLPF